MRIVALTGPRLYDGRQLGTAFVDEVAPGGEDVAITFEGPADVPLERMVDLDDVEAGAPIAGDQMAHLIVEHRGLALTEAVWRQRVLGRLAAAWLAARSGAAVDVRGDDLFVGAGKLSVSVATRSPRSALIHFAVNVVADGVPVRAACLRDLHVAPGEFLDALARGYREEVASAAHAARKVREVE